jgi:hypothetical protein
MTVRLKNRPAAIRVVIPFVFRHWLDQPVRTAIVGGGLLGATAADLFMPVFSGHLVDALTRGADDSAARHAAFSAFGGIVALGLTSMNAWTFYWVSQLGMLAGTAARGKAIGPVEGDSFDDFAADPARLLQSVRDDLIPALASRRRGTSAA